MKSSGNDVQEGKETEGDLVCRGKKGLRDNSRVENGV
jgi:hypothetical protein